MKAYILLGALALAFTFLLTPVVVRSARFLNMLTPVRERDVHTNPTPRLGGIAMMLGSTLTLLISSRMPYFQPFYEEPLVWSLMGGGIAICILGILDDLFDLTWWAKLAGQILVAGGTAWGGVQVVSFPIFGLTVGSTRLTMIVTVLVIVASTNAVNFVDGLDGLAAGIVGIGAFAFFIYSYFLIRITDSQSYATFGAMVAIVLVGVCVGFLTSNFHPAKIFMGDSGSLYLGLTIASLFIVVTGQMDPSELHTTQLLTALIPLFLPVAVMLLPLLDMTMAIIRRLKAGKSPFKPDSLHLHHRLLRLGHSHRRAVITLYLWALWGSVTAISLLLLKTIVATFLIICTGFLCICCTAFIMPGVQVKNVRGVTLRKELAKGNSMIVANRYSLKRSLSLAHRNMWFTQLLITVFALIIGTFYEGKSGLLSAFLASALASIIIVITILINKFSVYYPGAITGFILGGYLVKLVVVLTGIALFKEMQIGHYKIIIFTLILSFLLVGLVESRTLDKHHRLIVDPIFEEKIENKVNGETSKLPQNTALGID